MDARLHPHRLPAQLELAIQQARPEIKRLKPGPQITGSRRRSVLLAEFQTNLAQVQSVWILPQMIE